MQNKLKIYLVELKETPHGYHDYYDAFVCVAESEYQALNMHPAGLHRGGREKKFWSWDWEPDTSGLVTKCLGEAGEGLSCGDVICSSFCNGGGATGGKVRKETC